MQHFGPNLEFFCNKQTEHITKTSHPQCTQDKHGSAQTGHSPNIQPRVSEVPLYIVRQRATSDPRDLGRSSRDMATARAAAHDKREPQRRRHACSTRFLSRNLSERALSWASRLRNDRVSVDHRPPTSTPSTISLARPPHSVSACRIAPCFSVRVVVSTANWHNFQTACIMHTWSSQIHVTHHDVGGDSTPASRQIRAATFSTANPLLPRTPARAQAAWWWPLASSGRPHRQLRPVKGRGRRRRRMRRIRNKCGSKRVTRHNRGES